MEVFSFLLLVEKTVTEGLKKRCRKKFATLTLA